MHQPLRRLAAVGLLAASLARPALAQQGTPQITISLTDLSAFKNAGTNWKIVGDVIAPLDQPEVLDTSPGTGVLVNQPGKEKDAHNNLLSVLEHGDLDIAFDFLIAAHSNSGFYLQGRYEIQLLDSWGVKTPAYGDNGGIYKRRELPSGRLYEGHAPRTNASKAPGLWQHMEVSFQAPRFDASGQKIANAIMLKITLNGVVLHENVELSGPTGGPISEQEAPTGPFMIQGDHGAVAFRRFTYRSFSGKAPTLTDNHFKTYASDDNETFAKIPDFSKLKVVNSGTSPDLSYDVVDRENNFGVLFNGTVNVPTAGRYYFDASHAGLMRMSINGKPLFAEGGGHRPAEVDLPAGKVPYELAYVKREEWMKPTLGLYVAGPGFRQVALHSIGSTLASPPADPILIDAPQPIVTRSFMDFYKDGKRLKRIVHAVSVGSPEGLHYTFDLDNGALAQGWRGDYLDATPMWHDRGDGSSRPRGMVVAFNDRPAFTVLPDANAPWPESLPIENTEFRPLGYDLDATRMPTFRYLTNGTEVEDKIRPADEGKALSRELSIKNPAANLYHLVASGQDIIQVQPGLYAVEGKSYYVKAEGATLRTAGGQQQLVVPVTGGKISYSLLF